MVRTAVHEWGCAGVPAGTLLSYGLAGNNPSGAIAGVNALNWSLANVGPSFPPGEFLTPVGLGPLSPYSPIGYWTDPAGNTPESSAGPFNYRTTQFTGIPGLSSNWGNIWQGGIANFTMPAEEAVIWAAQIAWWIVTFGGIAIYEPAGVPALATYAYRSRYQVPAGLTGFQCPVEIWAQTSSGALGWDNYALGKCYGTVLKVPSSPTETFALQPGVWREVACPTATSGSGTLADGFLGLGVFEVWGISWAAWQAATGL